MAGVHTFNSYTRDLYVDADDWSTTEFIQHHQLVMEGRSGLESSPFASRLDSNYIATDAESLEIQNLLKDPTSRLNELSTRLQELDEQYTRIQNEKASLLLSVSKHRALKSLVRKLPIDILQEIFIACLPTTHNAVMSKLEPPILLTQVCSSWRIVAHGTPQLWKSIHIAVPCNSPGMYTVEHPNHQHTVEQVTRRRSEAVLEWIARSAACPLDISLNQWANNVSDGSYSEIIEYLIRFSERWRKVSFSAPYHALVPVAALPTSKVPLLESLYLNCAQVYPVHIPNHLDRQSVWTTSAVMKAPKLHEICLTHLNEDVTRLPINWSQLTNLSLERASWSALSSSSLSPPRAYQILSSCRNLISCRLDIGIMTEYDEPLRLFETSTPLISLPFLTKLSVREGANLSRLFDLLHLPSLNSLEFHTTIRPTQESSTTLFSLLTHSYIMIQYLITDAQFFKQQDFIKCLKLCPFLKSLAIRKVHAMVSPPPWVQVDMPTCRVDDAFLRMFTSSDDGGYLCPHLEDFESSSETAFSENALLQFIREKNGSGEPSTSGLARLKRLFVIFYGRPLIDINPELELYKQAGLDATITYPHLPFTAHFSAFEGLPNTTQPGYPPFY